jgi:hypothetical protein
MDHDVVGRHDAHQPNLARGISPGLGERSGRHVDILRELQQPDHPPVGSIDRDQGARVEDYRPRTLRAHAVSSSVAGPSSARMSARTFASVSRRARSFIADATHALTEGARPAATAVSAERTEA